jgi:hypothetical protein
MAAETITIKADRYIGPNVIGNMYRAGDKVEKGYLVLDLEKLKLNWCSPNQDNILFALDPADENIGKIICAKKASSLSKSILLLLMIGMKNLASLLNSAILKTKLLQQGWSKDSPI